MAMCTSAIMEHHSETHNPAEDGPLPWVKLLTDGLGAHPAWVNDLLLSDVGDITIQRAGAFVNTFQTNLTPSMLRQLVLAKAPIWIHWGTGDPNFRMGHLLADRIRPSRERFIASRHIEIPPVPSYDMNHNTWVLSSNQRPIADPNGNPYPEPIHGTRQLRGENVMDFLARQKLEHEKKRTMESSHRRIVRENRQVRADSMACPQARGARVYRWDVCNVFGHRLRVPVRNTLVYVDWKYFNDKQKVYNADTDEWDMCTDIDPTDSSCDNNNQPTEDAQEIQTEELRIGSGLPPHEEQELASAQQWEHEVQLSYQIEGTSAHIRFTATTVNQALYMHYGLGHTTSRSPG
ncbi:hypothetical protein DFH11DRAFT_1830165 [Phellopilus nigrolimitatus]|nr:hypothetical protein DFH11DRAFT_1830165 [Phellopilus nigrolimitatus]